MDGIVKSDPDFEESCMLLEDEASAQNSVFKSETEVNSRVKEVNKTAKKNAAHKRTAHQYHLSSYKKKSLLNYFKQIGFSQRTLELSAASFSVDSQLTLDYFTKASKDAQDFVYQECDSLSFNNITEWLKYFQIMGGPKECNYEAAIILNGIANTECHPTPELMNGVDLRAIYKFLSYAMLGLPQDQLDATSAKFLSNEFQNLVDEANTDEADIDVHNMKRKIEDALDNNSDGKINSQSLSLDPLNIALWNFNSVNK